MQKNIISLLLISVSLFAYSKPLHVELNIYRNVSFMTKIYQVSGEKNISISVPVQISLENINIKAPGCTKKDTSLSMPKLFKNDKIKKLKSKIVDLNNQIISLKERNNILKSISLKDKKANELAKTLDFFDKNFIIDTRDISSLISKLNKAKQELKDLQNQKVKRHREFITTFTCKEKRTVKITYPQYNFAVRHFYEIRVNMHKKSLNFIKKIKILEKTGEDFKDLDIIAHSNAYNQRVYPTPFYPKYLNFRQKREMLMAKSMPMDAISPNVGMAYKEDFTTSSFIVRHISLTNNTQKIIELDKNRQNATFENDIDGYGTSLAYLKTNFKSDKFYQGANAFVYLNGNQVGTKRVPSIKKDAGTDIYLGENQNIKVKKTLIKRFNESEFFGNNQINTQIWRYSITNISKISQKINLIERLPISQNAEIVVKPLFDTKIAKIDKKGKVVWNFSLTPNQTKIIKFGYETKKPKK